MTLDEHLDDKIDEYHHANVLYGCGCAKNQSPCDFCIQGYSLPLAEFIEHHTKMWHLLNSRHKNYDRVMREIF